MKRTVPDRVASTLVGLLVAALAAGCAPTGPAVDRAVEKRESFTRDEGPKAKWRETEVAFPPYPGEEHLTKVQLSGPTSFAFLVDTESIRVDEDGVVRYTLIARSPSGSDNVSFEGMRCETGEYKPYAFGSVDNTWLRASNGEWSLIRKQRANDIRYGLYRYYFCPYGVPQRDAGRAIAALKQGIPLPAGR